MCLNIPEGLLPNLNLLFLSACFDYKGTSGIWFHVGKDSLYLFRRVYWKPISTEEKPNLQRAAVFLVALFGSIGLSMQTRKIWAVGKVSGGREYGKITKELLPLRCDQDCRNDTLRSLVFPTSSYGKFSSVFRHCPSDKKRRYWYPRVIV